jgi:hypothetical protein
VPPSPAWWSPLSAFEDPIVVENGKPVLDEFVNVKGGVRSPYVDVSTSGWTGSSGASFCFIAGHEIPFTRERLRMLYPRSWSGRRRSWRFHDPSRVRRCCAGLAPGPPL